MLRNPLILKCVVSVVLATSLTACDAVDKPNDAQANAITKLVAGAGGQVAHAAEVQGPLSTLMQATCVELFTFTTTHDVFMINGDPGGLFPPMPMTIDSFDEPELASGFLTGFRLNDFDENLVGFGTEQEVIDLVNYTTQTTYTLTMPERGTLMLGQEEDLAVFLNEINDMISSQEYVRSYDPPLVTINTIPGTGHVIGGTGEFEGASGSALEIGLIHQINLIEQSFDLGVILVVGFS